MRILSGIRDWLAQRNIGSWLGLRRGRESDMGYQQERQLVWQFMQAQQDEADDRHEAERSEKAEAEAAACRGEMLAALGPDPEPAEIATWVAERVARKVLLEHQLVLVTQGRESLYYPSDQAQDEARSLAWALASGPDRSTAGKLARERAELAVQEMYRVSFGGVDAYRDDIVESATRAFEALNQIIRLWKLADNDVTQVSSDLWRRQLLAHTSTLSNVEQHLATLREPDALNNREHLYSHLLKHLHSFHHHLNRALEFYVKWLDNRDANLLSEHRGELQLSGIQYTYAITILRSLHLDTPSIEDRSIWKLPDRG